MLLAALLLSSNAQVSDSPPAPAVGSRVWTAADFPQPPPGSQVIPAQPGVQFPSDPYPKEALKHNEQGRAVARVIVGPDGTATRCWIIETSKSVSLDEETCRIAMTKVRYRPGKDEAGNPVESQMRFPVNWILPR